MIKRGLHNLSLPILGLAALVALGTGTSLMAGAPEPDPQVGEQVFNDIPPIYEASNDPLIVELKRMGDAMERIAENQELATKALAEAAVPANNGRVECESDGRKTLLRLMTPDGEVLTRVSAMKMAEVASRPPGGPRNYRTF